MAINPELGAALTQIDTQTTRVAKAVDTVRVFVTNLLNEITALPTSAEVQELVDRAKAKVNELTGLADNLETVAHDPRNPVPTPIPEPPPVPEPIPEPTPVIEP